MKLNYFLAFKLFLFIILTNLNTSAQTKTIYSEDFNNPNDIGTAYTMKTLADGINLSFQRTTVNNNGNIYITNETLGDLRSVLGGNPENHDGSRVISFANPESAYANIGISANFDEGVAITTQSIDINSYEDLKIGLIVTSTNNDKNRYSEDDGLDIQYELNNSGVWTTVGSFRGRGTPRFFPSSYHYLYEDTDLNGALDTQEINAGPIGPDFKDVLYSLDDRADTEILGQSIKLRVAFYSESEDEGSFDDLIITGTLKAPSISFTSSSDESCDGSGDGSITATVDFGIAPYNYVWTGASNTNSSFETSNTITELSPGTYSLTVTDSKGNKDTDSFTIGTASDVEKPTFNSSISDRTIDTGEACSSVMEDFTYLANVTDNCDDSPVVVQSPAVGTIITGTTLVTLTATDASNNSSFTTFNVSLKDITKPVIRTIEDQKETLSVQCTAKLSDYTGLVIVTDNCDSSPVITQSPLAGTEVSSSTFVTITVKDASNNTVSTSFNVTLEDVTAPTIEEILDQSQKVKEELRETETTSLNDYTNLANFSDCDKAIDIKQTPIVGTRISGTETVTLTVTDSSGNTSNTSFNVNVISSTLSIDIKTEDNNSKVYPNPTTDFIEIESSNGEEYVIVNILGETLLKGKTSINEKIDVRNLNNSVYFIKFNNGSYVKFIKK